MRLPAFDPGSRELSNTKPHIKGTDVRHLQQALKWFGLYRGKVDGIFGPETEMAVRLFQRVYKGKPTGIADKNFFNILNELKRGGAGEWITYRRDFCHTGYAPFRLPDDLKASKLIKVQEPVGLVAKRNLIFIANKERIEAFDLSKRKVIWKNEEIKPISITLTSESILASAHDLAVVDAISGKVRVKIDKDTFVSPVAVYEGVIYAVSTAGTVYALSKEGEIRWYYRTGSDFVTPPAVAGGFVFFGSLSHVYCLDERGTLCWKTRITELVKEPIAIFENKVFAVTREGSLCALDAETGQILWKKSFGEEILAPCFWKESVVIVTHHGKVLAFNTASGKLMWEKQTGAVPSTLPFACADSVFIGTDSGLLRLEQGAQKERIYLEGEKINYAIQAKLGLFAIAGSFLWELSPL
ncbi:MAG: PQQ-binding-like beta-propeller repeat protein [Thermosediminibacteraceae bacterium]|nr:PQQ-binding-like beta-propeller repeat protein [Thermosediminibacteraceae bacterium]